jgi:hypothetical protein
MMFAIHPLVEMVPHAIVTMVTQDIIVYVELDTPAKTANHPQVSRNNIYVPYRYCVGCPSFYCIAGVNTDFVTSAEEKEKYNLIGILIDSYIFTQIS